LIIGDFHATEGRQRHARLIEKTGGKVIGRISLIFISYGREQLKS